jgi:hypothetical protein
MNFYFNGCSWTHGDELKNPQLDSWPAIVSRRLNANFLNDAVNGGTNGRTVYKTVQMIDEFDFFFVAWTHYTRFTEYNPIDNFEVNFNPNLHVDFSLHQSNDLKMHPQKYHDYGKMYYKWWQNEYFEFTTWLQQIIFLQSLFSVRKKKYLMINTFRNHLPSWLSTEENFIKSTRDLISFFDYVSDDILLEKQKCIQKLHGMIDTSRFVGWNDYFMYDLPSNITRGPGQHPLENGHQLIAEKILECYDSDLQIYKSL